MNFNPFRQLTAEDILRQQLRNAESARVEHASAREYHAAIEAMSEARIKRIKTELSKLEKQA